VKRSLHVDFKIAFGKKLREIRLSKNFTQQSLANLADIELSTLNRIELGKAGTSLTNIIALSEALKIHPKELFDIEY
jgi:transcriptional regulator with XRE-family HTH domain